LAVGRVLDRRIALDQMAELFVIAAIETQEVDAGLGGDALAFDRSGLEQRQLVGSADVQHVQAGVVLARQRDRQLGRLLARFARADVGMELRGNVVAVFRLVAGEFGVDHRRVFAVGDDRRGHVAEDRVQRDRIVDQHVAGGRAHEHLHPRRAARVQRLDRGEVVVARAKIEAEVAPGAAGGAAVLVLQRGRIQGRRAGVGHVHERGQPAGHRRGRFGGHVGLVFHARFAEVDLVVDHARQQAAAARVDHGLAGARRQAGADFGDALAVDAQVAVVFASFVDQAGVDDQGRWHEQCPEESG
ncbi:hypothetical protein CATMIT_01608, partial [Catenibacterium mitsuokai DSM 15897]